MRRVVGLLVFAICLLPVTQSFAEDPGSGFIAGLKSALGYYNDLENWIVTSHIPQIERRQLAKKMQNLSDAFFQLKNHKAKLTNAITKSTGSLYGNNDITDSLDNIERTITCLQANLNDFALQIRNQSRISGPIVKSQLSEGLRQKYEKISDIATNIGLKTASDEDAVQKVKKDSADSEALADQLATVSLEFAHKLDPSSSPPQDHKPCAMPKTAH